MILLGLPPPIHCYDPDTIYSTNTDITIQKVKNVCHNHHIYQKGLLKLGKTYLQNSTTPNGVARYKQNQIKFSHEKGHICVYFSLICMRFVLEYCYAPKIFLNYFLGLLFYIIIFITDQPTSSE